MSEPEKRTFTDDEALAFHRYPTPGKIAVVATKPMATQRDLSLAYSPGVAAPVLAIAGGSGPGLRLHLQGQSGGGDLQRHRHPGPGRPGRPGRQAGDGGQERPLQALRRRRHRRHRGHLQGPRRDHHRGQEHRRHLRRHQSGGHQEPRVLPHRDRAAGTPGHPGVPRRPARHGDHLRRRPDQRLRDHRAAAGGHQGWCCAGRARRASPRWSWSRPWACGPTTASRWTTRASSTAAAPRA